MKSRERRRACDEKTKRKGNRDKSEEYEETNLPVSPTSGTITSSTYPQDTLNSPEYAENQHHKNEQRKINERCQQRSNEEQQQIRSQEQKIDHTIHRVSRSEDVVNVSRNDPEKSMAGRHEKPTNDEYDRKHRTRSQPDHKRSKEHKEGKETKKTTHKSPSRNRPDDLKNRESFDKSKDTSRYSKSKSISEKLEQLEDTKVETAKVVPVPTNNTKHYAQKEIIGARDGDTCSKHKSHKESSLDRKNGEEVRPGRSSKRSSSKGKTGTGERWRRSLSENRDNTVKQSSSDKRRLKKRTESQRERKKEKRCKRCRCHLYKVDQYRAYYSDSELDCGKTTVKPKSNFPPFGTESDVSAMCHVLSTKDGHVLDSSQSTKGSKDSQDSNQNKTQHSKKTETLVCGKCERTSKISSKATTSTSCDSIRNKLISALFRRIKSLLKETEELREERNSLNEKVTRLSSEYEKLKAKEEIQAEQEHLIKEKIETLAEEMKISNKDKKKSICWADDTSNVEKDCYSGEAKLSSSTFRDEVHHILKNIQRKYQSHWKEHEHKINQVQTDAENEIQSLMKNIVSKYVEIGEIKDRNEGATNMVRSKHVTEPLYISTKSNSNSSDFTASSNQHGAMYEMLYPKTAQHKNDLLLKVTDAVKSAKSERKQPLQAACREPVAMKTTETFPSQQKEHQNAHLNYNKPNQSGFLHPRESMMPMFAQASKYSLATCDLVKAKNNATKTEKDTDKNFPLRSSTGEIKLHAQNSQSTCDDTKLAYVNKTHITNGKNGNTQLPDKTNKTNEPGLLTKKDAREFWRQKLSQPMPIDTVKEFKEPDANSHAHLTDIRRNFN